MHIFFRNPLKPFMLHVYKMHKKRGPRYGEPLFYGIYLSKNECNTVI